MLRQIDNTAHSIYLSLKYEILQNGDVKNMDSKILELQRSEGFDFNFILLLLYDTHELPKISNFLAEFLMRFLFMEDRDLSRLN